MRHFGMTAILLATLQLPEQEPIPNGRCPACGGTGCVPQDWTEGMGLGFKSCPHGCPQIADEEKDGGT